MKIIRYTYPFTSRHAFPTAFDSALARRMGGNLENHFENFFEAFLGNESGIRGNDSFPIDVFEDQANSYVRAELPGIARSDIAVEVVDGALEISATRKTSASDDAQTVTLKRSVALPENTESEKISATSENGVLTITLPKQEQAKPRKLTISVN